MDGGLSCSLFVDPSMAFCSKVALGFFWNVVLVELWFFFGVGSFNIVELWCFEGVITGYKWCNNILPWFCLGLLKCRHWYKSVADLWFNRCGFGGSWWYWRMTQRKAQHGMALIAFGWRPIVFWCFVIWWCFCCFDFFCYASCTLLLTGFGGFELMNLSKKSQN